MKKINMLVVATALATVLTATSALSCRVRPQERWWAIDAALPKTKLADTELAIIADLRAKAFALAGKFDAANYREAELATNEAIKIVGLVWVAQGGAASRGCGGTYRLKGETDER
jgi:hypothetical protein